MLLAGTNDLSRRQTTPRKLLDELIDSVNELQKFKNIKTLFLCKLPPRSDHAVINRKVSDYNDLMSQHFAENESVIVVEVSSVSPRVPPPPGQFRSGMIFLCEIPYPRGQIIV